MLVGISYGLFLLGESSEECLETISRMVGEHSSKICTSVCVAERRSVVYEIANETLCVVSVTVQRFSNADQFLEKVFPSSFLVIDSPECSTEVVRVEASVDCGILHGEYFDDWHMERMEIF